MLGWPRLAIVAVGVPIAQAAAMAVMVGFHRRQVQAAAGHALAVLGHEHAFAPLRQGADATGLGRLHGGWFNKYTK